MRDRRRPSLPGFAGATRQLSHGTCAACRKQIYASRKEARSAARVLHPDQHLTAYPCPCGGWGFHIGHVDQAVREKTARQRDRWPA